MGTKTELRHVCDKCGADLPRDYYGMPVYRVVMHGHARLEYCLLCHIGELQRQIAEDLNKLAEVTSVS